MIAGRYTRVRPVGRGGTGSVWLGRDESLGRDVALKRIGVLPGADTTDLARAEREAQLAARLHHPHVVTVLDVVHDDDTDAHWLVMEHVEGSNLAERVRDLGPLPPAEAARVLGQVADALAAAHAAGIVHRDVKPSNVLIDRRGDAKLTDFGIARLTTDPSLTQTGLVVGSPAYLAPEVAGGARGDEAVDVWSWGATLFHVLSGRPPYDSGETMGTLYRLVNEPAPRLPDASALAAVLEGAMTKDPERRWRMPQVRDFLEAGTLPAPRPDEQPTTTVPLAATAAYRTRRRRAGLPAAVAVLAVVALLALAGLLGVRLAGGDQDDQAGSAATATPSASATASPSASQTTDPGPTAAGMQQFIDGYVAAVGADPAQSWQMLTPKFQAESGGFEQYRSFWDPASDGTVSEVRADPESLVVSYQVRFQSWDNGPGPTVLQLAYDDGTYRIDGESSEGFVPAG